LSSVDDYTISNPVAILMASVIQMVHGTKFIAICGLRLLLETMHITWNATIPKVNWIKTIRIMVSVFGFSSTALSWSLWSAFIYQKNMIDKNQLLLDLFHAYYDARRNKRNKATSLAFEMNYESKLLILCNELVQRLLFCGRPDLHWNLLWRDVH